MKSKALIIFLILLMLVGGYLGVNHFQKMKLVKEAQAQTEIFLQANYDGITEIYVNKENYSFNPMGGLGIGGHVNGEKDLSFYVKYYIEDGNLGRVTSIFIPSDFPKKKEACKDKLCQ